MKKVLSLILCTLAVSGIAAQPKVVDSNRAPYRSEYISYSVREFALNDNREDERFYYPVEDLFVSEFEEGTRYRILLEVPGLWTDREVFLHTEGGRNSHRVYVNDAFIGSARDSRLPSEFRLTEAVRQGLNVITIEVIDDNPEPEAAIAEDRADIESVFLYSQPRIRIADYGIATFYEEPGEDGILSLDIIIENSFNYEEKFEVGYDVFSPAGKLVHYDIKNIIVDGRTRDTMSFNQTLYGSGKQMWSAESPGLYRIMMFIRQNGMVLEYIPVLTGVGMTTWDGEGIYRNGELIDIRAVRYNASDRGQTPKDIRGFKKQGANTIYVDYPQPYWFYDICDREGIYVIEQANINSAHDIDNMKVGGTYSNDPAWAGDYVSRVKGSWFRSRNHSCIIGWSIGGDSGNGYNMYKAYQWLREHEPDRPVVYRYANGAWNSDIDLPHPSVFPGPAATAKK